MDADEASARSSEGFPWLMLHCIPACFLFRAPNVPQMPAPHAEVCARLLDEWARPTRQGEARPLRARRTNAGAPEDPGIQHANLPGLCPYRATTIRVLASSLSTFSLTR